jgi:hypothetical protein
MSRSLNNNSVIDVTQKVRELNHPYSNQIDNATCDGEFLSVVYNLDGATIFVLIRTLPQIITPKINNGSNLYTRVGMEEIPNNPGKIIIRYKPLI